jgi:hypothetical protein
MVREPAQRWPVVGRRRKHTGHEQAQRKKKAEPVDKLIRIGAQMRVDLLVFLQQQRRSLDHQVTEPGRTKFVAQHNPTAAPFMTGSSTRHMIKVSGSQIAACSQRGGS